MQKMTIFYIILWIVLLLVSIYAGLVYRYHYRVVDNITVMQCTAKTFHRELLDERQPLISGGFDNTEVFAILRKHLTSSSFKIKPLPQISTNEISARLHTVRPWFCELQPIYYHTFNSTTKEHPYTQCHTSVHMHVQIQGTAKLLIVHPKHMSETPMFTELIVPEGYVLFVPFQWWTRVIPVEHSCVCAILSWRGVMD
jgi:hypothetical protein